MTNRFRLPISILLLGCLIVICSSPPAKAEAPGPTGDTHIKPDIASHFFGPEVLAATTTFYLPWKAGDQWYTSNGNCGDGHSCDNANAYAWDFYPYSGFGGEVVAVAAGTVCYVQSGIPDSAIFTGPHAGNVIVISHSGGCAQRQDGEFSFYAHLRFNSSRVTPGQIIQQG